MDSKTQIGADRPVAAITGASSGLGAEFAHQLAAQGFDLLLVARRSGKLEELKNKLESKYGILVEPFVADLSKDDDLARLVERVSSIENLEYMVNNAGFGLQHKFPDVDIEAELDMLKVHCIATLRLSHAALGPMCKRNNGYIINLASVAAFLFGMAAAEYYATKAYILSFSRSLQCDLSGRGVRVQALCPGFVKTGFHDTNEMSRFEKGNIPGFLWIPSDYVVRTSLKSVRKKPGKSVCIPSMRYKFIVAFLMSPFSGPLIEWMSRWRGRKIPDPK